MVEGLPRGALLHPHTLTLARVGVELLVVGTRHFDLALALACLWVEPLVWGTLLLHTDSDAAAGV